MKDVNTNTYKCRYIIWLFYLYTHLCIFLSPLLCLLRLVVSAGDRWYVVDDICFQFSLFVPFTPLDKFIYLSIYIYVINISQKLHIYLCMHVRMYVYTFLFVYACVRLRFVFISFISFFLFSLCLFLLIFGDSMSCLLTCVRDELLRVWAYSSYLCLFGAPFLNYCLLCICLLVLFRLPAPTERFGSSRRGAVGVQKWKAKGESQKEKKKWKTTRQNKTKKGKKRKGVKGKRVSHSLLLFLFLPPSVKTTTGT